MKINKFIGLILLLVTTLALGAQIHFSGTTPTEREDNSPLGLSEIAGFHIHCGVTKGDYTGDVFIAGATLPDTAWELDLPTGAHYCVVTTEDIDGRTSLYSNEVTLIVDGEAAPKPPMIQPGTIIRIVVTLP